MPLGVPGEALNKSAGWVVTSTSTSYYHVITRGYQVSVPIDGLLCGILEFTMAMSISIMPFHVYILSGI